MAIALKVDSVPSVSEGNLVEMLLDRAKESRGPAAQVKTSSGWKEISWAEVLAQ